MVYYNSNQQEFKIWSTKFNLEDISLSGYFMRACPGGSSELFAGTPLL